ncbi:recombinase RecA [Candidatus Babeliales bacterium]|nr:recombinase RecA [Candidatus Babeliales bacterium]
MAQKVTSKELKEFKNKALEVAFAQIDKQYGKGAVMLLGQNSVQKCDTVSTGSIAIDGALGIGGLPRGRVIEIYGPESSGKTTLTLHAIAEAQKSGGICGFIDAEHAMDSGYAKRIGVDVDSLIISQPDYGEQALDIAEVLIRSGAVDMLVIDSVAALVPKNELEGGMGDVHVGLQARLMSQALRKLTPIVHKSKTALIFINQIRHKVGGLAFMNKETTSGGNALKFYASVRLDIRRIATLKKGDRAIGNRVSVKVVKNKMAPPFKKVQVDIVFNQGISKELDLLDMALKYKIVKQSGAWFTIGKQNIAQGRDNCYEVFKNDKELFDKIHSAVLEEIKKGLHAESTA